MHDEPLMFYLVMGILSFCAFAASFTHKFKRDYPTLKWRIEDAQKMFFLAFWFAIIWPIGVIFVPALCGFGAANPFEGIGQIRSCISLSPPDHEMYQADYPGQTICVAEAEVFLAAAKREMRKRGMTKAEILAAQFSISRVTVDSKPASHLILICWRKKEESNPLDASGTVT